MKISIRLAMITAVMAVAGCNWDSDSYDTFVSEVSGKKDVVDCRGDKGDSHVAYIEDKNFVDENGEYLQCKPGDCLSEDKCCQLEDSNLRRIFHRSLMSSVCSAGYWCVHENADIAYCTNLPEVICEEGKVKCGNGCYDLTQDQHHCGSCANDCKIPENAVNIACEDRKCVVVSCKKGWHVDDSQESCVEDTVEICNGIDCTALGGWNSTDKANSCDGQNHCHANSCAENWHVLNVNGIPCEHDDVDNCGEHGKKCPTGNGIDHPVCVDAQCGINSCETGYHLSSDSSACVLDNVEECGSYKNNCTLMAGWQGGECKNGQCVSAECGTGYHVFNQTISGANIPCEANSNEKCPDSTGLLENCSLKQEQNDFTELYVCSDKGCKPGSCRDGAHWNSDRTGCEEDTWQACGFHAFKCSMLVGTIDLNGGRCEAPYSCMADKCQDGYHVYNDNGIPCEADSNNNCGSHGNKCDPGKICSKTENEGEARYECMSECSGGLQMCEDGCFDIKFSIDHCGDCGNKCAVSSTMSTECVADESVAYSNSEKEGVLNKCLYKCYGETRNCNGNWNDGCEIDMRVMNWMSCDKTCREGYGNCNFNESDGCETRLSELGLRFCTQCSEGYLDCNEDWTDGCEIKLESMNMTQCETCKPGFVNCDKDWSNGCETRFDSVHMTRECNCAPGYGDCDNDLNNGCETKLADYGLKTCTACVPSIESQKGEKVNVTSCGETVINDRITIPMCIILSKNQKTNHGLSPKNCEKMCNNDSDSLIEFEKERYSPAKCQPKQICMTRKIEGDNNYVAYCGNYSTKVAL